MEEIWKDIEGFEGYYQISNLGRVKTLPRTYTYTVTMVKHVAEKIQMVVVDNFEKVKEFMKVNIESIKEIVDDYIRDGTLSIVQEITKDDSYYLSLKNNNHSMFECDGIWFRLDSFEFTYNIPFNFNSF